MEIYSGQKEPCVLINAVISLGGFGTVSSQPCCSPFATRPCQGEGGGRLADPCLAGCRGAKVLSCSLGPTVGQGTSLQDSFSHRGRSCLLQLAASPKPARFSSSGREVEGEGKEVGEFQL